MSSKASSLHLFLFVLLFMVDYVLEKHWCKSKEQVMEL